MNIGEANAVSRLLDWITGQPGVLGPITTEQALNDAEYLAERTHKILFAGMTPERVRAHWPTEPPGQAPGRSTDENGTT